MPQLDLSTFPSQLFWLAVIFVLLYLLMSWVALPRVSAMIVARRARIEGDLERATQMKAETEAVMAAYERSLADARAQAHATPKEAMDRFCAEAAARQRKATELLNLDA